MIGTNRKILMFFLLLFMAEGSGMVYAKDVYERDLYVEAFTHYYDKYLSDSYKDGDTIYIKQVSSVDGGYLQKTLRRGGNLAVLQS